MEYYFDREQKYFEAGPQIFGSEWIDNPSEKELNIAHFKRGLSGELITLYRGIKYYDKKIMLSDLKEKLYLYCDESL